MVKNKKNQGNEDSYENKKVRYELIIIGFLIFAFFGILFLSNSKYDVNLEYNFYDQINLNKIEDIDYIELGNLNIENEHFLSKRIDLDNFYVCVGDDSIYNTNRVSYKDRTFNTKTNVFSYGNEKKLDINAKSSKNISIYSSINYDIKKEINNNPNLDNFNIYVYNFEDNKYYYRCNELNPSDAVRVIDLKINFDKSQLLDDGLSKY